VKRKAEELGRSRGTKVSHPKGARHRERDTLLAAWPWTGGGTRTIVPAKRATSFPWARAVGPPAGENVRGPEAPSHWG
jgi:hypothetical protein